MAIGESTIQELIKILYGSGSISHWMRVDKPLSSGPMEHLKTDIFLSLPRLRLLAANTDRLQLELEGLGNMTLTPRGGVFQVRNVKMSITATVRPRIIIGNGQLTLGVDSGNVTVTERSFVVLDRADFSPPVRSYVDSEDFRQLLQFGVRLQLASAPLAPPIDVGFLGGIANAAGTTTTVRIRDGAMVVGIDVNDRGVDTSGAPDALSDFRDGAHIAMWTNPAAARVAFSDIAAQVGAAIASRDATLDAFDINIQEDHLHISGAGHRAEGSSTFSMNATPRLGVPGPPRSPGDPIDPHDEELWFEISDLTVTTSPAWWARLIEIVLAPFGGFGVLMVERLSAMARMSIRGAIIRGGSSSRAKRELEFTMAGTREPVVRVRIERLESHAQGVFTALNLWPQFGEGRVIAPRSRPAQEVLTDAISCRVDLPFGVIADHPKLRVAWVIRRTDTNEILQRDMFNAIEFRALVPRAASAKELSVECRAYLTTGTVEELYSGRASIKIEDRLDQSHPYVMWRHQVYTPDVEVDADGMHRHVGTRSVDRVSAIHRTALPGRCRTATEYSWKVDTQHPYSPGALEYLDQLPFPLSDLIARRAELCDYCFFGGPTRTVPRIPIR